MTILHAGSVIPALSGLGILRAPDAVVFIVDPGVSGFTLQNAIDDCVAGRGDIILMLPGGNTVTATVNFNKSGIAVVAVNRGLSPLVSGEFSSIVAAASFTNGPVVKVTQPCKIYGMGFASRDTGALFFAGAACLLGGNADAAPFGVHMKNCRFPKFNLDNRIGLAIEGSSDCLIEECTFEGVGADFAAGIYVQGACQNLVIRNNHFRQCVAAVQFGAFAGGGPHIMLGPGNIVEDGLILDSQGNTATGIVLGNYSELAAGSSYDASVGTLQAQGIQFSGNRYSE